jgi:2-phosphoglycerate kinase
MHKDVEDELANNEKSIFEAVFIDPTEYHDKANVFLIVTLDEAEHRRHFFEPEYRTETDELKENFQAVRLIQQYLIEEAQNLNVRVIHNDTDLKDVLKKFELN